MLMVAVSPVWKFLAWKDLEAISDSPMTMPFLANLEA